MDILRTKEKKHNIITTVDTYDFASGDNAGEPRRCCRICAGERGLRSFFEPKERLDYLLYRCFGVVVTPADCLICEDCASQLSSSEQFRLLVEAAFPNSPSDYSDLSVASDTTCVVRTELETLTIKPPIVMTDSQETIKILPKPKKVVKEKRLPVTVAKKINVTCNTCKQRYPMMTPAAGPVEDFVCSRCKNRTGKRKAEPVAASTRVNNQKGDFRMKPKLLKDTPTLSAKPLKKCESVIRYHREPRKYQCSQCTQKFMFAQRLAEHVKTVHRETLDNTCVVCGRMFKTQTSLKMHLKIHTGELHQCDVCLKNFRNHHALQAHYASHIKKNKALGWHHAANLVLPVAKK